MKTTLKIGIASIIAVSAFVASCGKYEEGPKISLASKKGRLTREWKFEKYIDAQSGIEVPCNNSCDVYELKKDGSVAFNGATWGNTTWQLSGDKEKLEYVTTTPGGTVTVPYTILRLTSKEVWLKDVNGDQEHYVAN